MVSDLSTLSLAENTIMAISLQFCIILISVLQQKILLLETKRIMNKVMMNLMVMCVEMCNSEGWKLISQRKVTSGKWTGEHGSARGI